MLHQLFAILCLCASVVHLKEAEPCSPDKCKLPKCYCSTTDIPGGLKSTEIPQLVVLTYDDAVTIQNKPLYDKILNGRKNPDNCSIGATFFVSHEYADYALVHDLYTKGHEIAVHSITHNSSTQYWKDATTDQLSKEFAGEKKLISKFAFIPEAEIKGTRVPLLEYSDKSMIALGQSGFTYDCSWPTQSYRDPGLWPYTADYISTQDCTNDECPHTSVPGLWVFPMIDWEDSEKRVCAMVDACINMPGTENELLAVMKANFDRLYKGNRAPFGVYMHAAWFNYDMDSYKFKAYLNFLNYMQSFNDVHLVTISRALEWVQNPSKSTNTSISWPKCRSKDAPVCKPNMCKYQVNGSEKYMNSCIQRCTPNYPWLNNPEGN